MAEPKGTAVSVFFFIHDILMTHLLIPDGVAHLLCCLQACRTQAAAARGKRLSRSSSWCSCRCSCCRCRRLKRSVRWCCWGWGDGSRDVRCGWTPTPLLAVVIGTILAMIFAMARCGGGPEGRRCAPLQRSAHTPCGGIQQASTKLRSCSPGDRQRKARKLVFVGSKACALSQTCWAIPASCLGSNLTAHHMALTKTVSCTDSHRGRTPLAGDSSSAGGDQSCF